MTGAQYEKKGLRRLEQKYPNQNRYFLILSLMGKTERQRELCKGILTKNGLTENYKQWHEEYLDLMEIVGGFAK